MTLKCRKKIKTVNEEFCIRQNFPSKMKEKWRHSQIHKSKESWSLVDPPTRNTKRSSAGWNDRTLDSNLKPYREIRTLPFPLFLFTSPVPFPHLLSPPLLFPRHFHFSSQALSLCVFFNFCSPFLSPSLPSLSSFLFPSSWYVLSHNGHFPPQRSPLSSDLCVYTHFIAANGYDGKFYMYFTI